MKHAIEQPLSGWALERVNNETKQIEWLYAACGLSEVKFMPIFYTSKDALAYKAARMPGSGWCVVRVKVGA